VEALSGDMSDLPTLYESCISGDARRHRLELLWGAEINGAGLDEEGIWPRIPNTDRVRVS
jgi:hypothetical protein